MRSFRTETSGCSIKNFQSHSGTSRCVRCLDAYGETKRGCQTGRKVRMKKLIFSLSLFCFATSLWAQPDPNYKPRRLNKAIELLEDGQPIYYTNNGAPYGAPAGYEEGKKAAQTWADVIMYEGEHSPIDLWKLRDFMRGIVDGGPTNSGHRFPAVIVTLPVLGYDKDYVKNN